MGIVVYVHAENNQLGLAPMQVYHRHAVHMHDSVYNYM